MKQHLKTKVLDDKALKLSTILQATANIKFFIYISSLHVNEVILNLKVSYVYSKSVIIITVYF